MDHQDPDQSPPHKRLRRSGGYRDLRSFHTATIIYDATVSFCARFVDARSRLVDQMVQAARSGIGQIHLPPARVAATSWSGALRARARPSAPSSGVARPTPNAEAPDHSKRRDRQPRPGAS